jgi:hypothetical protein
MWAGLTHDAPHLLIALGTPFSQKLDVDSYWRKLYKNIKERLAKWAKLLVGQQGRLLICKAMLVSMATYNLRNLLIPPWFEKALKRDMAAFVWQREPQTDLDEEGTSSRFQRWLSSSIAALPANMGGLAELDPTLFSQGVLVGWTKRFIHPRKAPWKLLVEHWLSPLITIYTNMDVRWLLVSTVLTKHIVDTVPCGLWKQMFKLWGKIREQLKPCRQMRSFELIMSQPVWFNKRLKLSKLTFSTDHTTKAKWAPLASLDVSTLRDLWGHENQRWYTPSQMALWTQWCIPHLNKPLLRKRIRERMKELLKHIKQIERPIVRGGPTPFLWANTPSQMMALLGKWYT